MAQGYRGILTITLTVDAVDEQTLQRAASLARVAVAAACLEAGTTAARYGVTVGLTAEGPREVRDLPALPAVDDFEDEDADRCPECERSHGPHYRGSCPHGAVIGGRDGSL